MKTRKTIVAGCSWADRKYKSRHLPDLDTSWKKWDEYVGESYGWDIINVGLSGASNDVIFEKALKAIYNNDVERCIICLSEWGRFITPSGWVGNPMTALIDPRAKPKNEEIVKFLELFPFNHGMQRQRVRNILFDLYKLIDICDMKNIEVVVVQMIDSIENFQLFCSNKEYVDLNNMMLDDPYFERVEESNAKIMGWPFVKDLGGYNVQNLLQKGGHGESLVISTYDRHPNEKGHKEISNIFMKWYDK